MLICIANTSTTLDKSMYILLLFLFHILTLIVYFSQSNTINHKMRSIKI